ncbi:Putative integral membrane protein [hydrothermal vent metagenome]|uniref:Putative integral membrane protein n=1 Tax=hydrothermal vent metagenome TaxID=652676 RepID=A0A1W1CJN2_9ZZZZ
MEFQIIDMVIIGIILFLSIKGLVNGFSRELFNFLGLIGGIAIAARTNEMVGDLIVKQNILPEALLQYQKIIGFVAVFILIWIIFNLISSLFSTFTSDEIGIFSRIFGYFVGVARYTFIFALIIFGFNNANFLKEKFSKYTENSQVFAPMSMIGGKLLNKITSENNQTVSIENNSTRIDTNSTNIIQDNSIKEDNVSQ